MPASERGLIGSTLRLALAAASTVLLVRFCNADSGGSRAIDKPPIVQPPAADATALAATMAASGLRLPQVFTYYFYWYDAETSLHLAPSDPLPTKPVPSPLTSYRSVEWHRRQLADMEEARVDVVLPVYWGEDPKEPWSSVGLDVLVQARRELVAAGHQAPRIGMFYDTSIVRGLDLTTEAGMAVFSGHVRSFFGHIPPEHRSLVDGRPVVWLFSPQENTYDQRVFDFTTAQFHGQFGVAPFVVRESGWKAVTTDASYTWGAAQNGVQATDLVATVGPGYDERQIPGRGGVYRARQDGRWYRRNLETALLANRPLVAIETWNELHEASGIGQTVEYGRTYIEITRELIEARRGRAP